MTWLRTREIKPGVYETQSVGRAVGGGMLGALLALGVIFLGVMVVAVLFSGNWEAIWKTWLAGGVVFGIAYWHYRHNKAHPGQRRGPGPWDA